MKIKSREVQAATALERVSNPYESVIVDFTLEEFCLVALVFKMLIHQDLCFSGRKQELMRLDGIISSHLQSDFPEVDGSLYKEGLEVAQRLERLCSF